MTYNILPDAEALFVPLKDLFLYNTKKLIPILFLKKHERIFRFQQQNKK